jgi:hypothetical protein
LRAGLSSRSAGEVPDEAVTRLHWRRLLPGLWAGLLLCIGFIATPAPFAALAPADAGRVVARIFVQEAWLALALAGTLLMLERRVPRSPVPETHHGTFSNSRLLWGTIVCTLLGYFAVQPLLPAARAGQGLIGFAQLHLISVAFFALKVLLVLVLAWRAAGGGRP